MGECGKSVMGNGGVGGSKIFGRDSGRWMDGCGGWDGKRPRIDSVWGYKIRWKEIIWWGGILYLTKDKVKLEKKMDFWMEKCDQKIEHAEK